MLHELANYAETHDLPGLPGYKAKRARWLIVLAANGQFVDVTENDRARTYPMCPHLEQSELVGGATVRSHFLLDGLPVVTGYGDPDAAKANKRANFVALLHQAAADCPALALCADLLDDPAALARVNATLAALKAKPTDTATFRVGLRDAPDMTEWRAWWQRYRTSLHTVDAAGDAMLCFLTGEPTIPQATHGKVTGLSQVGGQSSGSSLISFDKEAFTSYGLQQSANAACSETAVAQYRAALDDLVQRAPRPLGGMLTLHWYDRPIDQADDPLLTLLGDYGSAESDEAAALEQTRALLEAVRAGKRPELVRNRYYVFQVSGAGGRVMVRDWFSGDFGELAQRIGDWFDHLEIVGPKGGDPATQTKFAAVLTRLVSYRPTDKPSDTFKRVNEQLGPLTPRLWRAILQGGVLPDSAAQAALAYARSKLLRANDTQQSDNLDRVACAILKAWLIRHVPREKGNSIMEAKVNTEHPAAAYHAGRLLAVLAAAQTAALGDVGAGVVQRYYAAASATPALVLGRLIRNAQYHLDKIESKGLAGWYDGQIRDVVVKLGDAPPATLNLEGQTLFALGYYQQRAAMYTRKTSDEIPILTEAAAGGK